MENVKKILSEHYVNPEESSLIHSKIREKGRFKIIDKISVKLDSKKISIGLSFKIATLTTVISVMAL